MTGFGGILDPDENNGDWQYNPFGNEQISKIMAWYEKRTDPSPDQMLEEVLTTVLGKDFLNELLSFPIMGHLPEEE